MTGNPIKFLVLFSAGFFILLLAWMNLTPGYFRMVGCTFGYYTDQEIKVKLSAQSGYGGVIDDCMPTTRGKLLLLLSELDINK